MNLLNCKFNESAKFEKNLQKVFALSFELKETTPFSFKGNFGFFVLL